MPITEELIEQVDQLARNKVRPILADGYPFFEWCPGIEIHETISNYEEENIMVGEKISIQYEYNLENMEIEESDEANDDVNDEEIIEDDKKLMRGAYVTK